MSRVEEAPGRPVRLRYLFKNAQAEPVELWLSVPPDGLAQDVHVEKLEPATAIRRRGPDPVGINDVAYLVLDPSERCELVADVRPHRRELVEANGAARRSLSDSERERWLRETPLVPVGGEVADAARRIVEKSGARDDRDRAWALFAELATGRYAYVYPPVERGAASMLANQAGDCGEFSFLFEAWCRSLGIPARTIVGSWARGRTQAHVWNEFFLDGAGWVPVDASMASLVHKAPWQVWLMGKRPGSWEGYFGALADDRVAFSVDPDVVLDPPFTPVDGDGEPDMRAAGRALRWGYDVVEGGAPYLQPAYPRFPSPPTRDPKRRWRRQQPLGRWRVRPTGLGGLGWGLRSAGVALLVLAGVLALLGNLIDGLDVPGTVAALAGVVSWVLGFLLR
jgi:Transglutaminase-like superfamily